MIEPLADRMSSGEDFLHDIGPSLQYHIVPISDPFGPTKEDPTFEVSGGSDIFFEGGEVVQKYSQIIKFVYYLSSLSILHLTGTFNCLPFLFWTCSGYIWDSNFYYSSLTSEFIDNSELISQSNFLSWRWKGVCNFSYHH